MMSSETAGCCSSRVPQHPSLRQIPPEVRRMFLSGEARGSGSALRSTVQSQTKHSWGPSPNPGCGTQTCGSKFSWATYTSLGLRLPSCPLTYLTQSGGPPSPHLLSSLHGVCHHGTAIWNPGSVEAGLQVLLSTALSLHCCRLHDKIVRAEETESARCLP